MAVGQMKIKIPIGILKEAQSSQVKVSLSQVKRTKEEEEEEKEEEKEEKEKQRRRRRGTRRRRGGRRGGRRRGKGIQKDI
uniref:Uncharacterized protein n=1 Tax=Strongyloides stercoralis TaxID=6248 RepID=A0A0K0EPH0_STRER